MICILCGICLTRDMVPSQHTLIQMQLILTELSSAPKRRSLAIATLCNLIHYLYATQHWKSWSLISFPTHNAYTIFLSGDGPYFYLFSSISKRVSKFQFAIFCLHLFGGGGIMFSGYLSLFLYPSKHKKLDTELKNKQYDFC